MKDTTLESLEGRRNRSITPPPDIVKKRQQQAANQAGNQRAHHKPSSNIEHVRYNEDIHIHMHIHLTGREVMTREYHETVTENMNHESQEMYTVSEKTLEKDP